LNDFDTVIYFIYILFTLIIYIQGLHSLLFINMEIRRSKDDIYLLSRCSGIRGFSIRGWTIACI